MNWILLTLISAITGAVSKLLQKVLLKDEQSDTFAFSFVFQLLVASLFLLYTLVTGTFETPNMSGLSLNLIVMTIFYSLGNIFTFKAFQRSEASEVTIIYASSTMWAVIAAVLFLGEKLTSYKWLGIALIIIGVITINSKKTGWKLSTGHFFAAVGAMLFGLAFTNDAYLIGRYHSVASYMILAFALPGLGSLVYRPKSIMRVPEFFHPKILAKLFLCVFLYSLSAITIFTAYKLGGPASVISPIQQSSIIFAVILSFIFLGERDNMKNKIIGSIFAFAGILLLV